MEKNKIKYFIPLIIILILLVITIVKIVKNREDKLYEVLYGEIKYQAKKCYLNKECESTTTLEELYNLNYLETLYDPVTKEILDSKISIEITDKEVIINKWLLYFLYYFSKIKI